MLWNGTSNERDLVVSVEHPSRSALPMLLHLDNSARHRPHQTNRYQSLLLTLDPMQETQES